MFRESMIQTAAVINSKKEVNQIIAVHFDDENDPVYQQLVSLIINKDAWNKGSLVTSLRCDSKAEMLNVIEGK